MDDPILEKKLKKMFECRADKFPNECVSEARVHKNVYEQIERKGHYMKNIFIKKMIVTAAALCVLGSMTAFAIGKITGVRAGSSLLDEVHTYEQAKELQKEYGPKINFPTDTNLNQQYRFILKRRIRMEIQSDPELIFPLPTRNPAWKISHFPKM